VREAFRLEKLVPEDQLGARTKRLAHQVARQLVDTHGHDRDAALALAMGAIEGVGLGRNKKGMGDDAWKTEYLLFIPRRLVTELAQVLHDNRVELAGLAADAATAPADGGEAAGGKKQKKETKKDAKKEAKAAYPKEIQKRVEELLEGARNTVDLALFGRMIADKPVWNVEASCQVAQAISTNRVQMDFDFFTAVDDFKPGDTAGSDMMGTIQFNSSCFYRYAVLNVDALRSNIDGEKQEVGALVEQSLEAFVRAFVTAIPTGKQNSMAAHNFPSYALAIVRDGGPSISLTNAFLKPARPRGDDKDLVDDSIEKLEGYLSRVRDAMGDGGKRALLVTWADRDLPTATGLARSTGLENFYAEVKKRAVGGPS